MTDIMIPVSPGELVDKLTILRLKSEKITDPDKLRNVARELTVLQAVADETLAGNERVSPLWDALYEVNGKLWQIEHDIRACEARQDFGAEFVALARAVYLTNDKRAALKKQMNLLLGSAIVEEKSYQDTSPQ